MAANGTTSVSGASLAAQPYRPGITIAAQDAFDQPALPPPSPRRVPEGIQVAQANPGSFASAKSPRQRKPTVRVSTCSGRDERLLTRLLNGRKITECVPLVRADASLVTQRLRAPATASGLWFNILDFCSRLSVVRLLLKGVQQTWRAFVYNVTYQPERDQPKLDFSGYGYDRRL